MSQTPPADLGARLEALGRELGGREATFQGDLARARAVAEKLRGRIEEGLGRFQRGAAAAGAPHLSAAVSEPRVDDKHVRAVQLDLSRGRHRAIVTVKARGEVTLVGPFHAGKTEGPCRSFPIDSAAEIDAALASFLESFLEQAATP
ncbi:MAG TPA: hypothetical protein VFC77_06850 [Myxococcota bacterium]|nr:hypothetical protein [Myxococcota bacterium]